MMQKLPKDIADKNEALVIEDLGSALKVVMSDPTDLQKIKFLQTMLGRPIKPVYASADAIKQTIDTKYGAQVGEEVAEALEEVEDVVSIKSSDSTDISQISNAPVSRIVSMILEYGVKYKASDIHIEPREGKLSIRFRVNGVLSEKLSLPRKLIPPIVSRIKILADLKIDEHRIPQDGRFQIKVDETFIDLRVSVMPAIYGEKVVMRLLEKGGGVLSLEKTGLRGTAYKRYIDALKKTQGIILITGPTGSGKTQTLASSVAILNKPDVNIMTLEDPVEIRIDGINQVQVNAEVGLNFSKGLRAFLRQDPDIIMVGEIRDKETAELAIQAALTGHLVLSTLHTNSAAGALPRLLDMGIQPYLLASTINIVVGQRLVRTINDKCREAYIAGEEIIAQIQETMSSVAGYDIFKIVGDQDKVELFRPADTPECRDRGYSGRLGIFESFTISDQIGKLIMAKKSERDIQKQAIEEGMITMLQDGFMKALEGHTTIEEVLRVQN
jgi:type II secretory ATPase GspE/PulE/Tfp pilus assembly ATPase PilB-like protein